MGHVGAERLVAQRRRKGIETMQPMKTTIRRTIKDGLGGVPARPAASLRPASCVAGVGRPPVLTPPRGQFRRRAAEGSNVVSLPSVHAETKPKTKRRPPGKLSKSQMAARRRDKAEKYREFNAQMMVQLASAWRVKTTWIDQIMSDIGVENAPGKIRRLLIFLNSYRPETVLNGVDKWRMFGRKFDNVPQRVRSLVRFIYNEAAEHDDLGDCDLNPFIESREADAAPVHQVETELSNAEMAQVEGRMAAEEADGTC